MSLEKEFNQAMSTNDNTKLKELLLLSKVDPSDNNNRAIKLASYYGHTETVKLLLKDSRIDKFELLKQDIPDKLREEIGDYISQQRQDNIDKILGI